MADSAERDPFIESIASELRRPVRLDARFDSRVMAALEAPVIPLRAPAFPSRRPWILRSRTFSVSPLGALAAAAVVGFITFVGIRASIGSDASTGFARVEPPRPPSIRVLDVPRGRVNMPFLILAPDADSVKVVGEFNDWDESRDAMTPSSAKGAWSTTVPLTPGRYEYQFLVYTKDGVRRIPDPSAPRAPSEFGSTNSIVTVSPGR